MKCRKADSVLLWMKLALISAIFCVVNANAQTLADTISQCPRRPALMDKHVKVIYYDARQDRFFYENGDPVSGAMEIGDPVVLEVCHARFGSQFDFTVTEKSLPEAGAPVRGLDDVAGLIKGLPGIPGAKGVGVLESVKFTTYPDVSTLVARLHSFQEMIELKTELQLDLRSIQNGEKILEEDYRKYRIGICQMTLQVGAAYCQNLGIPLTEANWAPSRVDTVEAKIQNLKGEVDQAASAVPIARGLGVACPNDIPPSTGPQYRDRNQFVCFVNHTNLIIGQFKTLRALIQQPPLGSAAADLISQLEEFRLRVFTYQGKLDQVKAAVQVEKVLIASDPNVLLSRLKKIQDSYKDVVTPDDIDRIAKTQQDFIDRRETNEMRKELDVLSTCCGETEPQKTTTDTLIKDASRKIEEIRRIDLSFGAHVYQVNQELVQHIRGLYELYGRSEVDPIFVQMFTWSGNTGVIFSVKAADSFKPLDLNKLDLPMETNGVDASITPPPPLLAPIAVQGPIAGQSQNNATGVAGPQTATPGSSPLPGGTPVAAETPSGNVSTTTTSDFSVAASATTAAEVHKTYRFNVGAGILFSSARQDNFALRNVPGTDSNGNPTNNLLLVQTGKDSVRFDFPIFLMTYVGKPLDVYTSYSANQKKIGTAVGFSTLDVTNNAYIGGFFQPRLGLDFIVGLHLARRNVPDRGIVPGVTILDPNTTSTPIHQEWKPGLFVTVGFDALTFKKLFFGAN